MRTIDSHQLKGLEFYSTLLWHLHKVFFFFVVQVVGVLFKLTLNQ